MDVGAKARAGSAEGKSAIQYRSGAGSALLRELSPQDRRVAGVLQEFMSEAPARITIDYSSDELYRALEEIERLLTSAGVLGELFPEPGVAHSGPARAFSGLKDAKNKLQMGVSKALPVLAQKGECQSLLFDVARRASRALGLTSEQDLFMQLEELNKQALAALPHFPYVMVGGHARLQRPHEDIGKDAKALQDLLDGGRKPSVRISRLGAELTATVLALKGPVVELRISEHEAERHGIPRSSSEPLRALMDLRYSHHRLEAPGPPSKLQKRAAEVLRRLLR